MKRASDQVPDPRRVDDLEWRHNGEADAEMGQKSNMGGFFSLLERGLGNGGGVCIVSGKARRAAARARRIDQALAGAGVVRGRHVAELARIHFGTPRDNECAACTGLLKPVYAALEGRTAALKDLDPATFHAQLAKGLNRVPVQQALLPEPPPPTGADRRGA